MRAIRRPRLYQEVADEVRAFIVDNRLAPGAALPPERDLTARLGVGRTSLREAIRMLEMEGLVEVRHGRGVFVRAVDLQPILGRVSARLLEQGQNDLLALLEVREALELRAVELALQRLTDADVDAMRQVLERTARRIRTGDSILEEDVQFHEMIFRAARNTVLLHLVRSIADLLVAVRQVADRRQTPELALREHTALYKALRARDRRAIALMRRHLRGVAQVVLQVSTTPASVAQTHRDG